jgi:hypothetical protein
MTKLLLFWTLKVYNINEKLAAACFVYTNKKTIRKCVSGYITVPTVYGLVSIVYVVPLIVAVYF